MLQFKAIILNEIEKMYKKKKGIVILIISLIVIAFGQLAISSLRALSGGMILSGLQFPLWLLHFFALIILPLFVILICIDTFASEFSNDTMKLVVTRPISRFKIFAGKFVAVIFYALLNLFILMILATIIGLIFNTSTFSFNAVLSLLLSFTSVIVPISVMALIVILFSNIFKSGVGIFFLSTFIFIGLSIIGILFLPNYSNLFITPMLGWHRLFSISPIPIRLITNLFFIMLGYSLIFFTLGYYLYDKRDL